MVRARRLKVIVEADGGARGNPGKAGWGAVVREAATGEVLLERGAALGFATNNVAEYSGLIAGLKAAADLGAVEVEVRMDSKLVVEQMSGRWQIRNPGLRPLAAEAAALVKRFETVRFNWIPREENRRADALANAAMDGRELPDTDLLPPSPAQPASRTRPTSASGSASDTASPGPAGSAGPSGSTSAAGPAGASGPAGPSGSASVLRAAPSWSPPTNGPATRVVLVRHGETELTAQRRYSGRGDVPLSAAGRAQADATATRLSTVVSGAAAVVTSPLSRCVQTGQLIAAALGDVPLRVEDDLIECDFGDWEGLTFGEVRERWPDRLDAWLNSPGVSPPNGESFDAVTVRARAALTRVLETYTGEPVVLVSHVTPIKLILRDALAGGDSFLRRLFLDPAGISIVDVFTDGGVAVRTVNDTAHLPTTP